MADTGKLRGYWMQPQGQEAQGRPVDSQPPQAAVAPPVARPKARKGFSYPLTQRQTERVIKRRALDLAKGEGWTIPVDDDEFLDGAEVHFEADGSVTVVLSV